MVAFGGVHGWGDVVHGCSGVCMVPGGGAHGCWWGGVVAGGGHAWLLAGGHVWVSGWHTSYWNAFL